MVLNFNFRIRNSTSVEFKFFELLPFCLALKGKKVLFICLRMFSSMVSLDDDEGDTNSGDRNEEDYENQVGEGEE